MDILINELSLHKQFESVENFIDSSFTQFVKIFSFLNNIGNPPSKKYDFYNCQITEYDSFHSLMTNINISRISDSVRKYKTILDRISNEPYWEINKQYDSNSNYYWNDENVNGSSLAENFERNGLLISFAPSRFALTQLHISKDKYDSRNISNFYNDKDLLKFLYENKEIDFYLYCTYFYKGSKLNFEHVNRAKSFDLISNANDENEFLNSFNLFCEMPWQAIIEQGGKGKNKVGLAYCKYHDQKVFKRYNVEFSIDKFRCSQKNRAFGYRKEGVFYILEFDTTHKLSD